MDRNSIQSAAADAANQQHAFDAKARSVYIRAMVKRCEEFQSQGLNVESIKEKLPEFARDYPTLFETVTSSDPYHKTSLRTMLAMLDRMGDGNLSQHQASVIVGERLLQTFVKPQMSQQPR